MPEEIVAELGGGKRPKVSVTINGFTYRSSIASMGGEFLLPVSAEVRANAGVAAGDEVEIGVEIDEAPREVVVPPDFAAVLELHPIAKTAFERLSYSHQRQHVLAIEDAKTPETRQRRIEKAVAMLKAKP